jgi:CDP-paratose 2-epimerase
VIKNKKIIVIGGAGFIGTNVCYEFSKNNNVLVLDDLSRKGTEKNLEYLNNNCKIKFYKIDIRNKNKLADFFEQNTDIDIIIHLAAQVAVTTSIINPQTDFDINVIGTFNILNILVKLDMKPVFIYASTNKVYGHLTDIKTVEIDKRYDFFDRKYKGISEKQPIDFYTPYGCSKGAADQYVLDFTRIYGIKGIVFRQSCIYGKHQFGVEDQGWMAWLMSALMRGETINIFGNGKQVRDVLYITDLVKAYRLALENTDKSAGQVFNIGGGIKNSLSLLEFLFYISEKFNIDLKYNYDKIRQGDQKIFISDNTKLKQLLGWEPEIDYKTGISKLYDWLKEII